MRSLIHPFVPSARATSPRNPAKSAQQFSCRTEANCRPRTLLPNSFGETYLLPDGFLTALDPQVRLLTLPNFGVNSTVVLLILKWNVITSLLIFQSRLITGYVTTKTYLFVTLLIRLEYISWIYGTWEEILHKDYLKAGYFQPLWFS
jgi:hypothetical protein